MVLSGFPLAGESVVCQAIFHTGPLSMESGATDGPNFFFLELIFIDVLVFFLAGDESMMS